MSRPLATPKRYVLIEEGLETGRSASQGGGKAAEMRYASWLDEAPPVQERWALHGRAAGSIIPPITKRDTQEQAERLEPPISRATAGPKPLKLLLFIGLPLVALLSAGLLWWQHPWSAAGQQSSAAPTVEPDGDTLTLPAGCLLSRLGTTRDVPFVRFDNQYPEQWPKGLQLPFGFYKQGKGKLAAVAARPGDVHYKDVQMIPFKGVVRARPDELISYFRKITREAGLSIAAEHRLDAKDIPSVGTDPGHFVFSARAAGKVRYPMLYVNIALSEDMGGWTYLSGYWIYGQYTIREGEHGRGIPTDAKVVKDYESGEPADPNDPNTQPVQNENGRQPEPPSGKDADQ